MAYSAWMRARLRNWKLVLGLENTALIRLAVQHVGALERTTRDLSRDLFDQCDAEAHALSRCARKRPRTYRPTLPKKRPPSAVTTILEPPEDMRPMEITLKDRGDAIVLTGL